MGKLVVRILSILLFFQVAFSQEKELDYSNPKTYVLGGVSVEGNYRFERETILRYLKLSEGEEIRVPGERITSTIKRLWSTKMFNNINVFIDKTEGNYIYLKIALEEVPMLSRVLFFGIKKGDQDEIIDKKGLRKGKMITSNLIEETKNYVENKYIEKGYLNCKVIIMVKPDTTEMFSSNMYVRVSLGEKIKIREIDIEGNEHFSDFQIKYEMDETKEKSWWKIFSSSKFIREEFEKDKIKILEKYRKDGYRDAKIVSDSLTINDDNTVSLKIKIDEGKRYYFGDIKWIGNTIMEKEELDFYLGLKKGDIYNSKLLEERLFGVPGGEGDADIHSIIMNRGHLFSQVTPIETQVKGDSINIEIRVLEGPIASIEKIIVSGNDRTNDEVIYRNIRTKPGQLFNKDLIQRTYRELAQLNYFDPENIGVSPKPNPQKGTVNIEYTLQEKSTSQIELQGGWGAGRIIGTIGLSFNNFSFKGIFNKDEWKPVPLGDGQTLSLRAQATFGWQSYSLTLVDPWIGGRRPWGYSFSVSHSIQDQIINYSNFDTGDGRLGITSVSFNVNKRLGWPDDYFSVSQGISYQRYTLKDYEWNIYKNFSNGSSNNINYTISLERNSSGPSFIYPVEGSDISLSLKMTPPFSFFNNINYDDSNLEDKDRYSWLEFYKIKLKGTFYNSIWDKLVLATKLEFGYMGAYNNKVGIPPFERFEMGGSGMAQFVAFDGREIVGLRGYSEGSLTNVYGSGQPIYNKYVSELRYPIILKPTASIYALLFAEAGNVFTSFETFSPFELRRSYGAGVRIFMPMFGMLGFDFGYGLDPITSNKSGWEFHFLLGQQF